MLQNIRDNSQGLIAKFIIGLIIIPFALFGIDSLVGGGGPVKVATINGEDIAAAELDQAVDMERRRRLGMMGENVDPTLLDEKLLRGPALEQLIQQRLLLQSAKAAAVGISPLALDQTIAAMPQFQENGRFSAQQYQNVLRSNGYSTAYFKQVMAKDLLISQLNSGVAGSDFVTGQELQDVARIIGEQRSFRYLVLPASKVADQVEISDAAIEQYYDENIASYQTENRVKLAYIELKREDFYQPVAEEELREAYELEMASFESNDERRAAHILIEVTDDRNDQKAQDLATELAGRIANGEDFASVAQNFSEDLASAQNGGDLGYTSGDTFPAEFEQALAALSLNEVSTPVKTDAGYHLIKATDIKVGEKPSFDQRKAMISQRIQAERGETELVKAVESLRDLVFNSEGLNAPARELKLTVSKSDLIGRSSAEGVLANSQVLAAAFSDDVLEEGNNSEVMELSPDHFIVISVLEHQPPHAKPLEMVKASIVEQLSSQQKIQLMREIADQLLAQLDAGKSIAELAEEHDYQWQIEQAVTRNSASARRDVLLAAFAMPQLQSQSVIREVVTLDSGDVAIVQLEKIIAGRWQQFSEAEQSGIKKELERNAVSRSLSGYLGSLRERAEITIL